jgi:regulatory protein
VRPPGPARRREATDLALHYLALRDRTEHEVREYLRKKGFTAGDVDASLAAIRSWGYLRDDQVAMRWAQDRVERYCWGPARIVSGLRQRGVGPTLAQDAVRTIMEGRTEEALARRAAQRYLESHPGIGGARAMRRLAGFLERRGYSWEVIYRVSGEHFEPKAREWEDDGAGN